MTQSECTGDCEKDCSSRQYCPLMVDDVSEVDKMDLDEYIYRQNQKHVEET